VKFSRPAANTGAEKFEVVVNCREMKSGSAATLVGSNCAKTGWQTANIAAAKIDPYAFMQIALEVLTDA
jgi:hypothetical protein